jgi:GTP-binding protein EngB required for normal cell division
VSVPDPSNPSAHDADHPTEQWSAVAADLAELAVDHPDLVARVDAVAERARSRRFHIAVVGEFKRGKSTLLNALLGRAVLPTGVLPLTSVATEVVHGPDGATVIGLDGTRTDIGLDEVADHVTEAGNPDNRRRVDRVVVHVPVSLLATGLVLVDTPGIGSIHAHNTDAAFAEYELSDAAVVVLAADAPLSDAERSILDMFRERRMRTFVVVNRCDHLRAGELAQVRSFIGAQVDAPIWMVSARSALDPRAPGSDGLDAGEFAEFAAAVRRFVDNELVAARDTATRNQLDRIAAELGERLHLEMAAAALDAEDLTARVGEFERAAGVERESFEADRLLLNRRFDELCGSVGEHLEEFVTDAFTRRSPELRATADGSAVRGLEDRLAALTESIVADEATRALAAESARAEQAWSELASWFRGRLDERVTSIRAAASGVFDVQLGPLEGPPLETVRGRFTLHFHHEASVTEPVDHLARAMIPAPIRCRRATRSAVERLHQLLDRNAGRVRYELVEQLQAARRDFERSAERELDGVIASIGRGAERGRRLAESNRSAHDEARSTLDRLDGLRTALRPGDVS